jgi:hypothetical protein
VFTDAAWRLQGHENAERRKLYIGEFETKVETITYTDQESGESKSVAVDHELDDGKVSQAAIFDGNQKAEQS